MNYVITDDPIEINFEGIQKASVEDVFRYFEDKREIGVDTETTGLEVFTNDLLTLQLGDYENQFYIDCTTIPVETFKELLETKLIVLQNAKFDLKYLYKHGIRPHRNIYDTFLAERVLTMGLSFHRKSLYANVKRYFGVELDKSFRTRIKEIGLFKEHVIRYGCDDVKYLLPLKNRQEPLLEERGLTKALALDNQFVSVLAYIEFCGVYIDQDKWIAKCKKDMEVYTDKFNKLDQFVIDNFKGTKYVEGPTLFSSEFTCKINWNSPQQVIPMFEELGIDVTVYEKGVVKKSLEVSILEIQKNVHPIVPVFLEYQKAKKLVTTYGYDFLKHVNPVTGRIHTNFTQLMNTGRLSSGKDKENTEKTEAGEVNMQNIPAGEERTCFVPEDGNDHVVADYSNQESRVLADFANDPKFTDYISNPEKDLHSFMASLIFDELKGLSQQEIKKNHSDLRSEAKPATFTIPYGGNGTTIAHDLSLSKKKGDEIYENFMNTFPGLKNHFEEVKADVLRKGYITINKITERKSYIPGFEQFKAQKKRMNENFWNLYRAEKEIDSDIYHNELKGFVSKHYRWKGNIERTGLNFPVQGTSADISKLAGIYLYDWIVNNSLWGIVKICVPLHDEYLVECPKNLSHMVKTMLEDSMIKAAKVFCNNIPFPVTAVIADHWTH